MRYIPLKGIPLKDIRLKCITLKKPISIMLVIIMLLTLCLPVSFASDNDITLSARVDPSTGIVTITGSTPSEPGKLVTVKVINPLGGIDHLDQKPSDAEGNFLFTYVLNKELEGTYLVYAGGEGIDTPRMTSFNYIPDNGITLSVEVDPSTGVVTITGHTPSGPGKQVTVKVINPLGSIDHLDQKPSDADGNFSFTYVLNKELEGTYFVYVGGEGIATPRMVSFTYTSDNDLTLFVEVDPSTGIVTITAGKQVTVKVINPLGSIDYLDQKPSDANSNFLFTYVLNKELEGTYFVYVGGEGIDTPRVVSFTYTLDNDITLSRSRSLNGDSNHNRPYAVRSGQTGHCQGY